MYFKEPLIIDGIFTEEDIKSMKIMVDKELDTNEKTESCLNGRRGVGIYNSTFNKFLSNKIMEYIPNNNNLEIYERVVLLKYEGKSTGTTMHQDQKMDKREVIGCMIYLNDVVGQGYTIFYGKDMKEICKVSPEEGRVVFFDMDMWHKGDTIEGCTKYVVILTFSIKS